MVAFWYFLMLGVLGVLGGMKEIGVI